MRSEITKHFLLGKFRNPNYVMDAVTELQSEGYSVYDVYTPFPVHGLDRLLGIKRSRLTVAAFFFGMTGTIAALSMIGYMLAIDWPMDIGGKPFWPGPAVAPVTFELTVLFAAFGMVFSFFGVNKMYPGKKPVLMDDRVTDDVMVVALDMSKVEDREKAESIMKKHEAHEVTEKYVHDDLFEV